MSEAETQDPWESVPRQDPAGAPSPPPGYGFPPAAPPMGYYGYPPFAVRKTNALAIASLVCGICGFIYVVPAILGIVFGVIALQQIRRDETDGRGMAIAGIATGGSWLALGVVLFLVVIGASGN